MPRLPKISEIDGSSTGSGFFLCARKERRTGRSGAFLVLSLQDVSGVIEAKLFNDADTVGSEFEVGDFVAVQGRGNLYNGRLELVIDRIRRVIPSDTTAGFREEDCIPTSARPIDEMWVELQARISSVGDPSIRQVLAKVVEQYGDRLRIWPAARQVHHAYRGGLLEHVLKIMEVALGLADSYGLRRDLVIAGAMLHDIGKLVELTYDTAIDYSLEGNLVGHIVIGAGIVREAARSVPDMPAQLALELEHMVLSHHGSKELGSPVKPMTAEAMVLAVADDLDAKLQQVRQHLAADTSTGAFTGYHRYLERVLLKPSRP